MNFEGPPQIKKVEKPPEPEQVVQSAVEKEANYEGNDTLLYYERLKNPTIKKQLVDLLYDHYQEAKSLPNDVDEHGNLFRNPNKNEQPKSREQIEKELDDQIEKVFSVTALDYDPKGTSDSRGIEIKDEYINSGTVAPFSRNFETGEPWTQKQLSIIEAHEKGHGVRGNFPRLTNELRQKVVRSLDSSKVVIDDRFRNMWREVNKTPPDETNDHTDREILEYFLQPGEIIERMAQLKNYFGLKGEEEFTKKHLDYAKAHYIADTGMGMQIRPFLEAVTPETEPKFLELINSLGI